MTSACPIPTPAEREYGEILDGIEDEMTRRIYAAIEDATERARSGIEATGLAMQPPAREFFASVIHQKLFCTLCGADPSTFAGGRVEAAMMVIRNSQNIARHYWGAKIEADPHTLL